MRGTMALERRRGITLIKALARAFQHEQMLDAAKHASTTEMAAAAKIERGYRGILLRLTLLAPAVVQAVLDGRQPEVLTLPRLLKPFLMTWAEQRGSIVGPSSDRTAPHRALPSAWTSAPSSAAYAPTKRLRTIS